MDGDPPLKLQSLWPDEIKALPPQEIKGAIAEGTLKEGTLGDVQGLMRREREQ